MRSVSSTNDELNPEKKGGSPQCTVANKIAWDVYSYIVPVSGEVRIYGSTEEWFFSATNYP